MVRALTGEWRNKDGREALQATGVGDHAEGKRLGNAVWDETGGEDHAGEGGERPVEAHCSPQGTIAERIRSLEAPDPDPVRGTLEVHPEWLLLREQLGETRGRLGGKASDLGFRNAPSGGLGPGPRPHVCNAGVGAQRFGMPGKGEGAKLVSSRVHHEELPGNGIKNGNSSIRTTVPKGSGHHEAGGREARGSR